MQKYLHEPFLREGHSDLINDIEIVFIDKTHSSDPTRLAEN